MSKWRNTCPDVLLTRIEQGFEAQLYLLRQTGPTGFLVKEHDSDKKYKVLLGSTHECDCSLFLKEKELCKHVIWILTRKFRLAKDNPLVYQLGLNERDLNNVVYGAKQLNKKAVGNKAASAGNERVVEKKKEIETDDVCPICQEDIYRTKKALIHCKFGCGNSIHVDCMKIWADHQWKSLNEEIIKCPLCRTEFSSHSNIIKEYSLAKAKEKSKSQSKKHSCSNCASRVVLGKYFRCTLCKGVFLCTNCFLTNYHSEHSFEFRRTVSDKWSVAIRHGISLSPSVLKFDVNNSISTVPQNHNGSEGRSIHRTRSRLVKSANSGALPDLSLGVAGINLQSERRLPTDKSKICLPPLTNSTGGSSSSSHLYGRVKCRKFPPKKEHSLPVEGISDIISVMSLRQNQDHVGTM